MITGWLFKIVFGIALVGFLAVETVSPLVTRAQLDEIAHDAADNAALNLLETNDAEKARAVAMNIAVGKDAVLSRFAIDQTGVNVTVEREARSVLLKKIDQFRSWYAVKVSATASTVRR